jgi:hypothetical protein
VFGSINFNVRPERSDLWPVNAAMSKWDGYWMARWFYHTIPFEAGSDSAKALLCRRQGDCIEPETQDRHGRRYGGTVCSAT